MYLTALRRGHALTGVYKYVQRWNILNAGFDLSCLFLDLLLLKLGVCGELVKRLRPIQSRWRLCVVDVVRVQLMIGLVETHCRHILLSVADVLVRRVFLPRAPATSGGI